jgi:hypothetical protein
MADTGVLDTSTGTIVHDGFSACGIFFRCGANAREAVRRNNETSSAAPGGLTP